MVFWTPGALIVVQEAQANSIDASDRSRSRILEIEKELGMISNNMTIVKSIFGHMHSKQIFLFKKLDLVQIWN